MKSPRGRRRPTWCAWHSGLSDTSVLIRIFEQGSGRGGMLYACQPCRIQHGLTPLKERTI